MDKLGFSFLKISQAETRPFNVVPVDYEGNVSKCVLSHLTSPKSEGIQVVLWDSKKKLSQLKRKLCKIKGVEESAVHILQSHTKKDDPVYESIVKNGKIPAHIKFLFTTRLIADGVSIYNKDIGDIILVNVENEERFKQFPERFRSLDKLTVYSYRKHTTREYTPEIIHKALEIRGDVAKGMLAYTKLYEPGSSKTKQIRQAISGTTILRRCITQM